MNEALCSFSALRGKKVHLGVCGSVAAYKSVDLMRCLQRLGLGVSVCLTDAACRFISPLTFSALGADPVYTAMFGQDDGQNFAHLNPGGVADVFLVAPATAATLARLACGMADDLLSAQCLAFHGPLVLAPAMNPRMWTHAATQRNAEVLRQRGLVFAGPDCGPVACGETGEGKMTEAYTIVQAVLQTLCPQDYAEKKVLVTLGPTRENFDGVRYWTNASTGLMGACLVHALSLRGAQVHALAGPGVPRLPAQVTRVDVDSAKEMFEAARDTWPAMDAGIFSAAVADFSPLPHGSGKFKKQDNAQGFSLQFTPNPDILATLGKVAAPHQRLLGFAAETSNLEAASRDKLRRKKAHLLAGNYVGRPDSGFASSNNTMFVCDANGREEQWPVQSKADVAWRLLDWLLTL